VEVVDLHHDMAETGADLDRIELGTVNQLQGHHLAITGKVEHHQD